MGDIVQHPYLYIPVHGNNQILRGCPEIEITEAPETDPGNLAEESSDREVMTDGNYRLARVEPVDPFKYVPRPLLYLQERFPAREHEGFRTLSPFLQDVRVPVSDLFKEESFEVPMIHFSQVLIYIDIEVVMGRYLKWIRGTSKDS